MTEVRSASFLSSGFTTMAVINQPERKLAKRTSVQWVIFQKEVPFISFLVIRQSRTNKNSNDYSNMKMIWFWNGIKSSQGIIIVLVINSLIRFEKRDSKRPMFILKIMIKMNQIIVMISKQHILIDLGLHSQISSSNFWEKTFFIQVMTFSLQIENFITNTILYETWVFLTEST